MSNEQRLIFLLHGAIRALLVDRPVDEAYLAICKSIFPGTVLGEFTAPFGKGDHRYLTDICDYIYALDDNELSYASCYSASIAVQLIALAGGIDSEIVVGVKKQDRKMVGHAWVETVGFQPKRIISPGRIGISDFKVVKRLHPEKAIQSWMEKKRAILDAALES
jgi:Transglutaminase-like superfamily